MADITRLFINVYNYNYNQDNKSYMHSNKNNILFKQPNMYKPSYQNKSTPNFYKSNPNFYKSNPNFYKLSNIIKDEAIKKNNKNLFELWENEKKLLKNDINNVNTDKNDNIENIFGVGIGVVSLGFIAFIYCYGSKIFIKTTQ